ncbi:MAG: hypothetical protein AcusKO_13940 [Acuticoccus sp.]
MKPAIATIRSEIEDNANLETAIGHLQGLDIHCEAKDFGRPPPFLAALFELLTGRPFESRAGVPLRLEGEASLARPAPPRLPVVWMRIDTDSGHLALGSGRRIGLAERLDALEPVKLAALANGEAQLILDWSHENAPPFATAAITRCAARYGIPSGHIAILTQSAGPAAPPAPGEPHIIAAHALVPLLWRLLFSGLRVRPGEFRAPFGFAAAGPRERPYHYVAVCEEGSALRANLVSRLLEKPQRGLIAFPKDRFRHTMPGSEPFRAALDATSLFHERGDNHARVEAFLAQKGNLVIEPPLGVDAREAFRFLPTEALRKATLAIVCDLEMTTSGPRGLASDTLKALVSGLPFLHFGAPGTMAHLAEEGFDVLDDIIDHGYDAEPDPAVRFAAAREALEAFLARPAAFTVAEQDRLVNAAAHATGASSKEGPLLNRWVGTPLTAARGLPPASRHAATGPVGAAGPGAVHPHIFAHRALSARGASRRAIRLCRRLARCY